MKFALAVAAVVSSIAFSTALNEQLEKLSSSRTPPAEKRAIMEKATAELRARNIK